MIDSNELLQTHGGIIQQMAVFTQITEYYWFQSSVGVTFDLKFRGKKLNKHPEELD